MIRTGFFGTAEIALPVLRALHSMPEVDLLAVVSQPDRPRGRKLVLHPTPVKSLAHQWGIDCQQPGRLKGDNVTLDWLASLRLDVVVVMAYGQILPASILDLPPHGCVNVHTSLLPKYRGAAPIQWAIWNGEDHSGVTLMKMDQGMDTGDILAQASLAIDSTTTSAKLHDQLGQLGAEMILMNLQPYVQGKLQPRAQEEGLATHARKINKEDGQINWHQAAERIHAQVRALDPWPGCTADLLGSDGVVERLKILQVQPIAGKEAEPGTLCRPDNGRLVVSTGQGCLEIKRLQRQGGRPMEAAAFLAGYRIKDGMRFAT